MRSLFARPVVHVALLVAITAAVVFPNLGTASLWDDDEGVNAECTREMIEAGTWIIPTFNWDLRTAKPVLLYWLMRGSYAAVGVNELGARLPSAVMMFGVVLLTYDLGRRMFGVATGFLAGVITASTLELVKLAHAATTDSTLICFTVLYFWAFWRGTANGGRGWFVPCGVASGLAMLTKGPAVGLILPAAVVGAYFAWNRELLRLLDRRLAWGVLAWVLVAVPWYVFAATETKGEWPRAFFLRENLGRASEPMENHRGLPVVYEFMAVCLFFAPWSGFLAATVWTAFKDPSPQPPPPRGEGEKDRTPPFPPREGGAGGVGRPSRLLLLWLVVYFVACAAARTKLPHYIAPAYPALAILTARFLVRWMTRDITPPRWGMIAGTWAVAVTGLVIGVGMLVFDGTLVSLPPKVWVFPGLAKWAWIGMIPLAGAGLMHHFRRRDDRPKVIASLAASTVVFVALLAAFPLLVVDQQKAVKVLVAESGARQLDREVRVGSFEYTIPSLTFYAGRRVERFGDAGAAAEFLAFPIESYLFVPEHAWDKKVKGKVTTPHRVIARRYDFHRHCDVLVVTNR